MLNVRSLLAFAFAALMAVPVPAFAKKAKPKKFHLIVISTGGVDMTVLNGDAEDKEDGGLVGLVKALLEPDFVMVGDPLFMHYRKEGQEEPSPFLCASTEPEPCFDSLSRSIVAGSKGSNRSKKKRYAVFMSLHETEGGEEAVKFHLLKNGKRLFATEVLGTFSDGAYEAYISRLVTLSAMWFLDNYAAYRAEKSKNPKDKARALAALEPPTQILRFVPTGKDDLGPVEIQRAIPTSNPEEADGRWERVELPTVDGIEIPAAGIMALRHSRDCTLSEDVVHNSPATIQVVTGLYPVPKDKACEQVYADIAAAEAEQARQDKLEKAAEAKRKRERAAAAAKRKRKKAKAKKEMEVAMARDQLLKDIGQYAAWGTIIVGTGVAGYGAIETSNGNDSVKRSADLKYSYPNAMKLHNDAKSHHKTATVLYAVGAGLVVVGATYKLIAPDGWFDLFIQEEAEGVSVSHALVPTEGGAFGALALSF